MVGWHHQLNGHAFEQTLGDSEVFPGGSDGKESACSAGDPGSVPGLRRSPGEGNGNPVLYPCLENSMDRIPCSLTGYSPQGHKESDKTE